MSEAALNLWADCGNGLRPDPELTVTEWADARRWLSGKGSAEPGKWKTSRTPYLVKIMDALSATSPFEKVIVAKGSQIGATELGLNWLGYVIDQVPGPMLHVSPTVELAERLSKQRVQPMIDTTPCLRGKVKDPKSRNAGNTLLLKEFPNGLACFTGANSGVGLRSIPARYLQLDEVDGYPESADDEGDPVVAAQRALRSFGRKKKIFMNSTPLNAGASRIETECENADQLWKYHVPCPECHALQELVWAQVKWPEGKPKAAKYECVACHALIANHQKTWMLDPANGAEWVCERTNGDESSIAFHISALYSPHGWFSWSEAAKQFTEANTEARKKFFRNTVEGLSYAESTETPEWERLQQRRESYRIGVVPPKALFLTGAADVQKGRIEIELVGWARNLESWSVDYIVLEGDVAGDEIWRRVDDVLAKNYPAGGGQTMPISCFAVDSGYETEFVYKWAKKHPQVHWNKQRELATVRQPRTVAVVKGVDKGWRIVWTTSRADKGGKKRAVAIWQVSNWQTKVELYGFLRAVMPTEEELAKGAKLPPGYCHFPQYGDEYFKQLTAEQVVTTYPKGFAKKAFVLQKGKRNEALDCRAYNRAAAELFGISRFSEGKWAELERARGNAGPEEPEPPTSPPTTPPPSSGGGRRVISAPEPSTKTTAVGWGGRVAFRTGGGET